MSFYLLDTLVIDSLTPCDLTKQFYSMGIATSNSQDLNFALMLLSIIIATIAGVFTYLTYKLKIGQKAKASCVITYSKDLPYISSVIIENLKDKDLVIHDIYVKFGPDIYVDLLDKDFSDKYNIVVPPLGVKEIKFGPVFMYNVNTHRVTVESLFKTTKYKIVLSTSHGKLTCNDWGKGWNAISESLNNHHVVVVYPNKIYSTSSVYFKNNFETPAIDYSSYSDEVQYVVKITTKDGEQMFCKIYNNNKKIKLFENLTFSEDVLKDEVSIRKYLNKAKEKKIVNFSKIEEIYDVRKMMASTLEHYQDETIELKSENPWHFYTIGCINSNWENFKLWWQNRKQKYHGNR